MGSVGRQGFTLVGVAVWAPVVPGISTIIENSTVLNIVSFFAHSAAQATDINTKMECRSIPANSIMKRLKRTQNFCQCCKNINEMWALKLCRSTHCLGWEIIALEQFRTEERFLLPLNFNLTKRIFSATQIGPLRRSKKRSRTRCILETEKQIFNFPFLSNQNIHQSLCSSLSFFRGKAPLLVFSFDSKANIWIEIESFRWFLFFLDRKHKLENVVGFVSKIEAFCTLRIYLREISVWIEGFFRQICELSSQWDEKTRDSSFLLWSVHSWKENPFQSPE